MKYIFHHRKIVLCLWAIFLLLIAYEFFFYKAGLLQGFQNFFIMYPFVGYGVYFFLVSLRGLTFIPLTTLLLVMVPFAHPRLLFILTLWGTLITSYMIYYFSEALGIEDYFQKKYPKTIKKLYHRFQTYELPVIVIRSLLPFTPTDLICYIAWTLRINIKKMLLGVLIGEAIICAVYIWGADKLMNLI